MIRATCRTNEGVSNFNWASNKKLPSLGCPLFSANERQVAPFSPTARSPRRHDFQEAFTFLKFSSQLILEGRESRDWQRVNFQRAARGEPSFRFERKLNRLLISARATKKPRMTFALKCPVSEIPFRDPPLAGRGAQKNPQFSPKAVSKDGPWPKEFSSPGRFSKLALAFGTEFFKL